MTNHDERLDELQAMLFKELPDTWYYHIDIQGVPQASIHKDSIKSIMNTISGWHNKQVRAAIIHELKEAKHSSDAGWYATYRVAELEKEEL